jgi:hypothetical protein
MRREWRRRGRTVQCQVRSRTRNSFRPVPLSQTPDRLLDRPGDSLSPDVFRPFVFSESNKTTVPKVTVGCPLDELKLAVHGELQIHHKHNHETTVVRQYCVGWALSTCVAGTR